MSARLDGVVVVVVNYGSSALLREHLVAVAAESPWANVIVVDNPSSLVEREEVAALTAERGWSLAAPERNLGFGGGVNVGFARAIADGADVLITLNPDARIDADSLGRLVEAVRADPLLAISPKIVRPDGSHWFAGAYLDPRTGETTRTASDPSTGEAWMPWLSGACFAMSRMLWERTGGFDERYFLYWEDIDLSRRILDVGGRLRVDAEAVAVHDEGGTHLDRRSGRAKSEVYYYYNIRNRLLYGSKHLDPLELRRWIASTPGASYRILLQGGRRQLVRSVAPLRAYLTGIRDGRAIARRALRGLPFVPDSTA